MWSVSVSANVDANVVTGAGTGVGFVIGYNRKEGFVIKQIVSASFSVMSAAGGTISANVGIDWTDNPIGNSSNESFGGSVSIGPAGVGPAIGGDINFDINSGKHHPTGINVGIGLSAAVSPINFGIGDVEFHTKKSWNYVIEENLKNNNEPDISELINDYLEKNRYNNIMEQVYDNNKISCGGGK